ncbi:alpha/beta fold hydrolase [Actinomadura chibensis]|uniref:Alpha/beta hydrolase n=1 Tax=Actinomadura chibensis TaxID=392828 RepID=A0A5D0NLZ6_9ACTN|nr:alpha/beta hydrolase [Actinomadura chibensis]TYB45319.1 alpha/beta hydrolase [Actinomadura chibensis]
MAADEFDLDAGGGRRLHAYDTGTAAPGGPVVFWHHGTPNIGAPPRPLFAVAPDIRWVSFDRPGYGGSDSVPGRDVASAAADTAAVADALGIDRFAVMGHSGGGPHALACAALLPDRVLGAVSVSALAPFNADFRAVFGADFGADGLDWFAGMGPSSAASLRAAAAGRAAKERYEAAAEYDPEMFTPADHAALQGEWSWFEEVVGPAVENGIGGLVDDDLAYVAPWGFDPAAIEVPLLVVHGERDRIVPSSHGRWLAATCPTARLRLSPEDGHISVLGTAPSALGWLRRCA